MSCRINNFCFLLLTKEAEKFSHVTILFTSTFRSPILVCGISTAHAQCDNADYTIQASNFSYSPSMITIESGQSVAFLNMGGYHDVNGQINSITGAPYNNPEDFYLSPVSGNSSGVCLSLIHI